MALIRCEKCGGQVSDSALACPHCGFEFSERQAKQEASKEYTRLPEYEQKSLRKEYDSINKSYTLVEEKERIRYKLYVIFWALCFIGMGGFALFSYLYDANDKGPWFLLCMISALICAAGFIGGWVEYFMQKKTKCEIMRELKKFQAWLNNEKQLTYHVVLSEKEKAIFDSINI